MLPRTSFFNEEFQSLWSNKILDSGHHMTKGDIYDYQILRMKIVQSSVLVVVVFVTPFPVYIINKNNIHRDS